MTEDQAGYAPQELANVDPDEAQFRADTLMMHGELVELELYKIRRELFQDPALWKVNVGAGNPVEQTQRGFQGDPFNGCIVYNPTPVTLSIGFQAGAGWLAPAVVPPFTWASFPERYVNLSVAVLDPVDQAQTVKVPVTILRTKMPPVAGAGPYTSPVPPQPFTSLNAASAIGTGAALDNGYPRANASMVVTASAGVTAGDVQLQGSHDGVNWVNLGAAVATAAPGTFIASSAGAPMRYLRAAITTAITGGTVTATVASS